MKKIKKAQGGESLRKDSLGYVSTRRVKRPEGTRYYQGSSPDMAFAREISGFKSRATPADSIPKAKINKESMESMNKKSGGKVKRAQTGVTMAQRDSIKAANRARVDSTLTARAHKRGYATKEEYLKKEGVDVNKKEKYVGVSKENRAPTGDSDKESGIKRAIRKVCTTPHCIYSGEDKSGVKKKSGGRITSKKK